jgi:hypothetical protein
VKPPAAKSPLDVRCANSQSPRPCEGDTEQGISLEELEEVTLNEASALHARESVEATALEVDALVRQGDEAVAVVEHSPDPDVRLIRNIWARKGVLERVRGVKFMWGLFACNELLHRRLAGSTPHRAPAVLALTKHRGM